MGKHFLFHNNTSSPDVMFVVWFRIVDTASGFMYRIRILGTGSEEFEDTKGVIRIHKSKNNRQHNGQKDTDVPQ
jgi:hypothetical protein